MLNEVRLIGNLGKDPEIRRTQSGSMVANFSVATTEKWKDRDSGEAKERTEWHRITVWGDPLCKVIEQYIKKGQQVYVCGSLQTRKWQGQDGKDNYTTEVIVSGFNGRVLMLGRKPGDRPPPPDDNDRPENAGQKPSSFDEEIPF